MALPPQRSGVTRPRGAADRRVAPEDTGVTPQDCNRWKHRLCNVRAAACLGTIPAGPAAFGACLASIGASDCMECWFPD